MQPHQDWTPMVLRKRPAGPKTAEQHSSDPKKKIDSAVEPAKTEYMPRNISVQLVAARVAHTPKLSQRALANRLNLPIKTIQDIEQHRHPRDMALAQRIAKELGVRLYWKR